MKSRGKLYLQSEKNVKFTSGNYYRNIENGNYVIV